MIRRGSGGVVRATLCQLSIRACTRRIWMTLRYFVLAAVVVVSFLAGTVVPSASTQSAPAEYVVVSLFGPSGFVVAGNMAIRREWAQEVGHAGWTTFCSDSRHRKPLAGRPCRADPRPRGSPHLLGTRGGPVLAMPAMRPRVRAARSSAGAALASPRCLPAPHDPAYRPAAQRFSRARGRGGKAALGRALQALRRVV